MAGLDEVTIGETLADPDDPRPLPLTHVDEPSLSMTIGINTAPTSGQDGDKLTARLVKGRLDQEVVGNVSIRVLPGDRPDRWEVQGRGELQLAVLVEMMRREGFELTVGKPQVVTRTVDGKLHEPVERVSIDAPEEYLGVISQLLALRKGRLENMVNHGTGWIRMEHLVPARGLIGFRTEFLTETRGTGQLHHVFDGYEPWHGDLRTRPTGSLVADRAGVTTGFALQTLQERGSMFVGPTEEVYEGMIVGENSRSEDMDVNPTKEKKLTNMRQSSSEEFTRLIPKRELSLEQALEFVREDECVEVTPKNVRLRKALLSAQDRMRAGRRGRPAKERLDPPRGSPQHRDRRPRTRSPSARTMATGGDVHDDVAMYQVVEPRGAEPQRVATIRERVPMTVIGKAMGEGFGEIARADGGGRCRDRRPAVRDLPRAGSRRRSTWSSGSPSWGRSRPDGCTAPPWTAAAWRASCTWDRTRRWAPRTTRSPVGCSCRASGSSDRRARST